MAEGLIAWCLDGADIVFVEHDLCYSIWRPSLPARVVFYFLLQLDGRQGAGPDISNDPFASAILEVATDLQVSEIRTEMACVRV